MKMKKGLLTMLALLSMGSSAFAQGTVNVPTVMRNVDGTPTPVNEVIVLEQTSKGVAKIQLTGFTNYRDLQFDLTLPAGAIVPEGAVVPVKTAAASHTVAYEPKGVTDGKQTVRFVVYNDGQDGTVEKFVDGIAVQIPIEVSEDFVDLSTASLSTVITSTEGAQSIALTTPESPIEFLVAMMKLGDVNDNGQVNLADAVNILYATKQFNSRPDFFVEEVADVNGDGDINQPDAVGALYLGWGVDPTTSSAKEVFIEEDNTELDPD